MIEKPEERAGPRRGAADAIKSRAERKAKARAAGKPGVWFGLGMFGLVGWAVAVPTLIGVVLGLWLDRVAPTTFSWTLALLLAGVTLGCLNAWLWVEKERRRNLE
jgi:ATP synthase protein I